MTTGKEEGNVKGERKREKRVNMRFDEMMSVNISKTVKHHRI